MILRTKIAVLVAAAVLVSGGMAYQLTRPSGVNVNAPHDNSPADLPPANPANIGELVDASNYFAMNMFSNLSNGGENMFFSPYSIFTALGMVYEGARNGTADEIRSVFHFPSDNQTRLDLFKGLIGHINGGGTGCNLSTANALWVDKAFEVLKSYRDALTDYYKAEAATVDFVNALEESRLRINHWVEDQTNGKIKDLFPRGSLDAGTCLVLTNAIYFKGDWQKQFNTSNTVKRDFHPSPTQTVQAQMMVRNDDLSEFNYTENQDMQMLEMDYSGGKMSMLVVLPKGDGTSDIEKMLGPQKLTEWKSKLEKKRVDVYFPKFTLNTKYFLEQNLSDMGMPSAFTGAADFSGIDGRKDLLISHVIHQAYVSVDEKGTEAAAATGISFEKGAIEPTHPTFNADHPFIFIIQEKETGNILFMGKLVDPTK